MSAASSPSGNNRSTAVTYYLISDLHIGGEEALSVCDFEAELITFLKRLEREDGEKELIIAGDAFGLWEYMYVPGPDKLRTLIDQFPRFFEASRSAGTTTKNSVFPGNHEYERAC